MEQLLNKSKLVIQSISLDFVRTFYENVDWQSRLIGIVGARGTGKTTLLVQHLKLNYSIADEAIYLSLDDIYFTENSLNETIEIFRQNGGKYIYLDEVHKYPNWAKEIKNCYDYYPDLKIIFTGSSIIDLLKQDVDLSRRAVMYELPGLSFREYLDYSGIAKFPAFTLNEILANHSSIAASIVSKIQPIKYFDDYLANGYYPFFKESKSTYHLRLEQVVKMIIEVELQFIEGFDMQNSRKIYQLLYILASNVPFKPNISKLSEKIGIHRNTLVNYIHYLEKARLINSLSAHGKSISNLQKPEKIFLENPNLCFVLAAETVNKGTLRETFLLNQLKFKNTVSLPMKGDFLVNELITIEVGGKAKTNKQIDAVQNGYIAADNLEIGSYNKIPLWLFGFMY